MIWGYTGFLFARKIFVNSELIRSALSGVVTYFYLTNRKHQSFSSQQGNRLLFVFLFLELVVRPLAIAGARWLAIDQRIWWQFIQVVFLTILVSWLVMKFANVRPFIGTVFMAPLVKNSEGLSLTNLAYQHYRVFLLYICEPESVVGASQFVDDWIVHLYAENDLGILSRVLVSRPAPD